MLENCVKVVNNLPAVICFSSLNLKSIAAKTLVVSIPWRLEAADPLAAFTANRAIGIGGVHGV